MFATRPVVLHRLVLLAFLFLPLAVTGCGLDCFDDGALEAAYRDGEDTARAANQVDHDRGRADGLALDRTAGAAEGRTEGYRAGYDAGYESAGGYPAGYDVGYALGWDYGAADPIACSTGADDGWSDGEALGYDDGWNDAWPAGWDDGYAAGWDDGQGSCAAGATAAVPKKAQPTAAKASSDSDDERTCYRRGYARALDTGAYDRGLAEGKRDNPEYQAGYREVFPAAQVEGRAAGERAGRDDGERDGYDDGYAAGYDRVYADCYDDTYRDGYAAGWDDGWTAGWDDGWPTGYDDGYADGVAACP
jgi:flagellar biosynthesis/type III secretory pathway protein FliH